MFTKLLEIWYPRRAHGIEEQREYLNLIISFSYIGVLANICYLILNVMKELPIGPTLIIIAAFIGLLITTRYSKSYRLPAHILLGLYCISMVSLVLYFRKFPYTILLWMPVFSIISVYLVGRRPGSIWSFLSMLGVIAAYSVDKKWLPMAPDIDSDQLYGAVIMSIVLTTFCALYGSWSFERYISKLTNKLKNQNNELVRNQVEIENSIQEKRTLIAIVCHDIANPLTLIKNYASMLEGQVEEKNDVKVAKIISACGLLEEVISDVRQLESVQSGKTSLQVRSTDLVPIFNDIFETFKQRLRQKNLKLEFIYDSDIQLMVNADGKSLSLSVFNNLISNAIKFSHDGDTIKVTAEVVDDQISVKIKDTGIGMPSELVDNLFKHDVPTTRSGTAGEKGTGFGLPITSAFMEKYGGSIHVMSVEKNQNRYDHGTQVTLTFNRST